VFQQVHITNHIVKADQGCPHIKGTAGNEVICYWSAIEVREGDALKHRMCTFNITPAPGEVAQSKRLYGHPGAFGFGGIVQTFLSDIEYCEASTCSIAQEL
jgi:hypothetical protein